LYQGRVAKGWAQAIDVIHPELKLSGEQVMTLLAKRIWKFIFGNLDNSKQPLASKR